MANSVGTRPIILDTVTADPVLDHWIKVSAFQFDTYDADADTAVVVDTDDNIVWQANGHDDLSPVSLQAPRWINGLRLSSISAGVVRVYLD